MVASVWAELGMNESIMCNQTFFWTGKFPTAWKSLLACCMHKCSYVLKVHISCQYMPIHIKLYVNSCAICSIFCLLQLDMFSYIYIYIPGDDCLYASVYISARFGLSFYSPWSRVRNDGFSLQDQRTAILVPFCHTKVSSTPARPIATKMPRTYVRAPPRVAIGRWPSANDVSSAKKTVDTLDSRMVVVNRDPFTVVASFIEIPM